MLRIEMPESLSGAAAEVWLEVCAHLESLGVLSSTDAIPIARYCEDYVLWLKCQKHIEEYGVMYPLKAEDGTVKCLMPYPQVAQRARLDKQLKEFEREFGFTPAARKRQKKKPGRASSQEAGSSLKKLRIVRSA